MTAIKLVTRSFHPDANFGAGGLGFEGDDRNFSFDLDVTSRIYHVMDVNLQSGRIESVLCDSDPSANAVADKAINIAAESLLNPTFPFGDRVPDVPPMENDYSQERKKPEHSETHSITAYTEDGDQTANVVVKYAGKNFAFYGADTDFGHEFYSTVVPDLDVTAQLFLMLDRAEEKAYVQMTITGDGFPNAESFIMAGNETLGLATHIRTGTAMTQLPGGRSVRMCMTQLDEVDWTKTDTLGTGATANAVYDYMSFSTTEVIEGNVGRAALNAAHLGRDASGNLLRQIQDNVPVPSPRNYEWLWE